MKLSEVSAKGRKQKKLLSEKLEIVLDSGKDKPKKTITHTVESLVNDYVTVMTQLGTLAKFSTDIALRLYCVAPDDPYFKAQGPAFIAYIKQIKEEKEVKASVATIEALLKSSEPTPSEAGEAKVLKFPDPPAAKTVEEKRDENTDAGAEEAEIIKE
jgi:hypothetical protein